MTPHTVKVLRVWLRERRGAPSDPLFHPHRNPHESRRGRTPPRRPPCGRTHVLPFPAHQTHRDAHLGALGGHAATRGRTDVTIIALWLGHEQPATTAQICLHADMSHKQRAIDRVAPPGTTPGRYRPPTPTRFPRDPCDYADLARPESPPGKAIRVEVGITTGRRNRKSNPVTSTEPPPRPL